MSNSPSVASRPVIPQFAGRFANDLAPWRLVAPGAFEAESDGLKVAGFGNLRFADPMFERIRREAGRGKALLAAWERDGEGCVDTLRGDFAIACRDTRRALGLIAVDRFGTHSLFWGEHEGRFAFASRPADVSALLGRSAELDPIALHAYLYFHVVPAPMSICTGVRRLDGGELVVVTAGRSAMSRRYWSPVFERGSDFEFARERSRFFSALRTGVAEGIEGIDPSRIGCFLSGGTDSSTIAGIAGELLGHKSRTFSIVFDEPKYDERSYSRLAASHFGTEHVEHMLTAREAELTLSVISRGYEQPFGNASAVPAYACAAVAREHGIERMVAGDGGDELYGGNSRYATAWLLSLYEYLPAAARARVIEPALAGRPEGLGIWPVRKARGYVDQARLPMPDRLHARYNLLNRFGPGNVLSDEVLALQRGFAPVALEREVWARCADAGAVNRLLAFDFKFTLGDNDLPKVTRMCHAAGVEVAFPMLSDAVVGHSLGLPAWQKLRGTTLRYFFRRSLRGYLPDRIIDKPKHGFGMPFGEWVLRDRRLAAVADDALASLANRGLVRASFCADLVSRMSQGHAGYFGTMVWVLMMLELWLRESVFADLNWKRA
ncbi:MAG: asparagine synthase-related protein [Burkholderiaceae bacterium]